MLRIALSDQLKEETRTNHQLLEKQIITLIKNIHTTKDYSKLLMLFYTFFGAVELQVDKSLNIDCVPDYLQRRKTEFLSNDLYAMGVSTQPYANGDHLPQIENHLQAIGAMYVMEGSTLGGVHISKMISAQLNPTKTNSLNFFNGYKNDTQRMWQIFRKNIDEMLLDESDAAMVVDAASSTFSQFSNWIRLS